MENASTKGHSNDSTELEAETATCTLCALHDSESMSREEGQVLALGNDPDNHGVIGITTQQD